jgi:hypothetical protein
MVEELPDIFKDYTVLPYVLQNKYFLFISFDTIHDKEVNKNIIQAYKRYMPRLDTLLYFIDTRNIIGKVLNKHTSIKLYNYAIVLFVYYMVNTFPIEAYRLYPYDVNDLSLIYEDLQVYLPDLNVLY